MVLPDVTLVCHWLHSHAEAWERSPTQATVQKFKSGRPPVAPTFKILSILESWKSWFIRYGSDVFYLFPAQTGRLHDYFYRYACRF